MSDVSFNGTTKTISVTKAPVGGRVSLSVKDIYSWWKEWVLDDNGGFLPAFSVIGGEPTGPGTFAGSTFFVKNGWKIKPYESSHVLVLEGNIVGDGGVDFISPTIGTYNTVVQYTFSSLAQGISTSGSAYTPEDVAEAVRLELSSELNHIMTLQNGLTSTQATMLLEIYRLYGLDPTRPLVVSQNTRSSGAEIAQNISEIAGVVTVTRQ